MSQLMPWLTSISKGNYALAQRWNEKAISLGSTAARQNQRVISNRQSEPAIQTVPKTVSSPAIQV